MSTAGTEEMLTAAALMKADRDAWKERAEKAAAELERWRDPALSLERDRFMEERDALQRFKTYVHRRLDEAGVPIDPEPERNQQHGCRIEGRLNWIIAAGRAENQRRWCAACGKPYADAREAEEHRYLGGEHLCWMRDKACRNARTPENQG